MLGGVADTQSFVSQGPRKGIKNIQSTTTTDYGNFWKRI